MEKKFIRKIIKNGRNSYYLNLPKELVNEMKLRERQKMVIIRKDRVLEIKDWKK